MFAGGGDVPWVTVKTVDDIAVIGSQRRSQPPASATYMYYQATPDAGSVQYLPGLIYVRPAGSSRQKQCRDNDRNKPTVSCFVSSHSNLLQSEISNSYLKYILLHLFLYNTIKALKFQ